jgi:molecular chaperone GrpE
MARSPAEEDLQLDIDPALLEAAVASVENSHHRAEEPEARDPSEAEKRWFSRSLDLSEKLQKLQKELDHCRKDRDEARKESEEARRVLAERTAEFEATRQRQRKDREEAERVAEERVLRSLLDIVDNLERASSHASEDPSKVQAGLHMIMEQFRNQLRKLGAERIAAWKGSPFDPEVHEAVLHLPTTQWPAGTVVEEVASGFRLKGRLLRAARVVVAANPG